MYIFSLSCTELPIENVRQGGKCELGLDRKHCKKGFKRVQTLQGTLYVPQIRKWPRRCHWGVALRNLSSSPCIENDNLVHKGRPKWKTAILRFWGGVRYLRHLSHQINFFRERTRRMLHKRLYLGWAKGCCHRSLPSYYCRYQAPAQLLNLLINFPAIIKISFISVAELQH